MAPSPITLWDRFFVLVCIPYALFNAIRAVLTGEGVPGQANLFLFLAGFARGMGDIATLGVYRLLSPYNGTKKEYLAYAKSKAVEPRTLRLADGLEAYWVGSSKAERVLLYFHGGGYVLPAMRGHFEWLHRWTQDASKQKSTSALVLAYSLAPEAKYPTQLQQMITALNYLLTTGGRRPSQILIGGDSAGGNMTLATLSHLLHPHPNVTPRIELSEPLAGALLISPWVDMAKHDEIFTAHRFYDILGEKQGSAWSLAYRGTAPFDDYMRFISVDTWLANLKSKVSKVFVWAGSKERLVGSITEMATKLQKAHPNVEYLIEDDAVHIDAFFRASFRLMSDTIGTRRIGEWIASA